MGHYRKDVSCPVCKGEIRSDRILPYCSKKCEAEVEGYSDSYLRELQVLKSKVLATTSWAPIALDPIEHIHSTKPIPIFSDMHAPMHDENWLLQALRCSAFWESEYCIINGDFGDMNELSRHLGHYWRRRKSLEDDLEAMDSILKLISPFFKQVVWLAGNHCLERLVKKFEGELSAQRLSKLVGDYPNLRVTSRSFVDVNDVVRVCHPRQYSRIRGALAQKLAMRWQKHIATGHQHHAAKTFSPDGKFQAVDIPCMARVDLMDYVRNECNDFPEPMCGFGVVMGENIEVFTEHTNWKLYGLPEMEKASLLKVEQK